MHRFSLHDSPRRLVHRGKAPVIYSKTGKSHNRLSRSQDCNLSGVWRCVWRKYSCLKDNLSKIKNNHIKIRNGSSLPKNNSKIVEPIDAPKAEHWLNQEEERKVERSSGPTEVILENEVVMYICLKSRVWAVIKATGMEIEKSTSW